VQEQGGVFEVRVVEAWHAALSPPYGFRYNDARDNYVVDPEKMRVIERIFRMAGAEGYIMNPTRLAFNREGVQPPSGGRFWSPKCVREAIRGQVSANGSEG
jgi:hypothetical protein